MKPFILSLLFLSASTSTFCTTWVVTNSGNTFVPATLTIVEGDTVVFQLDNDHNAAEVTQNTWMANGSAHMPGGFITSFGGGTVLPTQLPVGTHFYVCQPHAHVGMKGQIIVQQSTSTDESPYDNSFNVYPNPTSGKIQLTVPDQLSSRYSMEVYDINGKTVLSKSDIELSGAEVDLSSFGKGIYYIRFRNGNEIFNRRVVIH